MSDANDDAQIGPTWKIRNEATGDVKTFFEWIGVHAKTAAQNQDEAKASILARIERKEMTVLGPPPGSS